ncbi:MAG: hypothetical protein M3510_03400 [Actinomycetota bacterium]|jgi:hypothetical protein|nr:hypothetical protein [Actinomycetota bacterium]
MTRKGAVPADLDPGLRVRLAEGVSTEVVAPVQDEDQDPCSAGATSP